MLHQNVFSLMAKGDILFYKNVGKLKIDLNHWLAGKRIRL